MTTQTERFTVELGGVALTRAATYTLATEEAECRALLQRHDSAPVAVLEHSVAGDLVRLRGLVWPERARMPIVDSSIAFAVKRCFVEGWVARFRLMRAGILEDFARDLGKDSLSYEILRKSLRFRESDRQDMQREWLESQAKKLYDVLRDLEASYTDVESSVDMREDEDCLYALDT